MHTAFTVAPSLTRTSRRSHPRSHRWRLCDSVDLRPPPALGSRAALARERLEMILQPLPAAITLSRPRLGQTFAVLLMRSGYSAVDALDVVGMDAYQRAFFDVRSRAWERYLAANFGVKQGVLADPRYFDFISYAQMRTTQRFLAAPAAVFEEAYQTEDGAFRTRVVRPAAPPAERTPAYLLEQFREETGRRVLDGLELPTPQKTDGDVDVLWLRRALGVVYQRFENEGFCVSIRVGVDEASAGVTFELVAPATLWGARALRLQRSIANDYDVWAGQALLSDLGVASRVRVATTLTGNSVIRNWRLVS